MKILVLNCGSSSLKYQLINMENDEVIASGKYEKKKKKESFITHKACGKKVKIEHTALDHNEAIEFTLAQFTNPEYKVIDSLKEINAVGHRIVHGGEKMKDSVVVDDSVIEEIRRCAELAPLHNIAAIMGIDATKKAMPGVPMVCVFDTAFHQTISKDKYIYPIPYKYYEKYGIRKYGAHGTSHMYVSRRLAEIEGKDPKDLKIVTCHLGQGSSICAVDGGKSIDTSMGLTPLGGIPMVTRSGDLDPSVVTYIMRKENLTPDEMENILNKESGVMGVSGLAPDFRVIESESYNDNERASLAMKMFKYSIASYIAKYAVAMNGIDAIIFTGGVGENQINIRRGICEQLEFMGVNIDVDANNMRGEEKKVSKPDSKVEVWVIPTNEELMIAKETQRLVSSK